MEIGNARNIWFVDGEWNLEAGKQAKQPEDSEKQVEMPLDLSQQLTTPELGGDMKMMQTYPFQ
jgi:hypothetical protein